MYMYMHSSPYIVMYTQLRNEGNILTFPNTSVALTTNMHESRACKVKKHIFHSKVFIHNEGEPMVNCGSECAIACLIW